MDSSRKRELHRQAMCYVYVLRPRSLLLNQPNPVGLTDEPFPRLAAFQSVRLYTREEFPVVEGHLLTIACKVKGPAGVCFSWRKDGAAVRTDRTNRNMWVTLVTEDDGDAQLSILNIDKAQPFDEGETRQGHCCCTAERECVFDRKCSHPQSLTKYNVILCWSHSRLAASQCSVLKQREPAHCCQQGHFFCSHNDFNFLKRNNAKFKNILYLWHKLWRESEFLLRLKGLSASKVQCENQTFHA